ncbi:MAG: preprotein translocase subunit SecG [Gammaproteobacteria bacterium]|nr:MAG: preprotein translocase subunit SecG [Gammaproteobacteria bacterium]
MNFQSILLVLHVVIAFALIGIVLIQHGKGADMGAGFGSGASGSVFGARGSASFLSKVTAALAIAFFATSLTMALVSKKSLADKNEDQYREEAYKDKNAKASEDAKKSSDKSGKAAVVDSNSSEEENAVSVPAKPETSAVSTKPASEITEEKPEAVKFEKLSDSEKPVPSAGKPEVKVEEKPAASDAKKPVQEEKPVASESEPAQEKKPE